MNASGQIHLDHKTDRAAIARLVLGLSTLIFPLVATGFLMVQHGGPGYLQSLFCGIPVAALALITGIVSLAQIKQHRRRGGWMAVLGIVFGGLFFVTFCVMLVILLQPFLSGTAH